MRAAGEQIPRLVCFLALDLQLGRQMLDHLLSDLVEAHVPSALRRDFSAQALTAAQSPSDVLFFMRVSTGICVNDDVAGEYGVEVLSDAMPSEGVDRDAAFQSGDVGVGPCVTMHQAASCPSGHTLELAAPLQSELLPCDICGASCALALHCLECNFARCGECARFLLHQRSPGEESSALEDALSDSEGSDDGNDLLLEPLDTDRYRFP